MTDSGESFFREGCSIIEDIRDRCGSEGTDILPEIDRGYELLDLADRNGYKGASEKAIGYFVEGCFPVFNEEVTLRILLRLAEYGFDEALFLCGHFLEFGTDGNPPDRKAEACGYYRRSYESGYDPATVSLARNELLRRNYGRAFELYEEAVRKDLRERREAVISIGFMQFFGLDGNTPSEENAVCTWTQLGTRALEDCIDYCNTQENSPDIMRLLKICRVSFEIGML